MATRVRTEIYDDLTGEIGASSVVFSIGGAFYEVDLVEDGRALREALEPFIKVGRRPQTRRSGTVALPRPHTDPKVPEIRAWARENGLEVSTHGRVPVAVKTAYEKAANAASGRNRG